VLIKADKNKARQKRHLRVRNHIAGTAARPRLNVYRSLANIYAQIIDDDAQKTLVSAGTVEKEIKDALENTDDIAAAEKVGEVIGKRATEKGITEVVFDRGGYVYQGKIAALAEAARKAGLDF
jgi:large subunit ribosomal protein L18